MKTLRTLSRCIVFTAVCGTLTQCSRAPKVGDPKEVVLDKYGAPQEFKIVDIRKAEVSIMSHVSDPLQTCRKAQPEGELWFWACRDDVEFRIVDNKVATCLRADKHSE